MKTTMNFVNGMEETVVVVNVDTDYCTVSINHKCHHLDLNIHKLCYHNYNNILYHPILKAIFLSISFLFFRACLLPIVTTAIHSPFKQVWNMTASDGPSNNCWLQRWINFQLPGYLVIQIILDRTPSHSFFRMDHRSTLCFAIISDSIPRMIYLPKIPLYGIVSVILVLPLSQAQPKNTSSILRQRVRFYFWNFIINH